MTEQADDRSDAVEATDPALRRLLEKLHRDHGFDFREYKPTSLARRIRARMQQLRIDDFDVYLGYLERHPHEHAALFNTILINITGFFRDPEAWAVLAEEVLPRLVAEAETSRSLRLWCPGCSSGEEAYSVAILLAERLGDRAGAFGVKIYATDVDEEALATARQGVYRVESVKEIPSELLGQYFVREGQAYRVRRDVRRWVIFGRHDLVQDPPLSHIDLLVCRNVLIYFTSDLQEKILARFHYAVREGGYLFLGRSESLLARWRGFTPVSLKWRIFQRTAAPVPAAALAAALGRQEPERSRPAVSHGDAVRMSWLRRVLEALPTAVMVIDADDDVLLWNAAAEALFEIPADAALRRKFRDLDVSYRIEGLRARVEEAKTRNTPAHLDGVTFNRRSGDPVYANLVVLPLADGPRVPAVVVVATDASELARLREQMSRLAEQYATAIEELQSTNEELETTNEELQSTNEELATTNEELQSTNEELETTVEELQATNTELAAVNAELERRTAELRRLEEHQRLVLSSLDEAVFVVDAGGIVTTWNQAAEQMWRLPAEAAVGRAFTALPLGDLPRLAGQAIARVQATAQPEVVPDVPFVLPTGETRRAPLRLAPLRGPAGVMGVVATAAAEKAAP